MKVLFIVFLLVSSIQIVITCPKGYYSNANATLLQTDNTATSCRKCSSCPVGYGVKTLCSKTSDTKCEKCIDGESYSTKSSKYQLCQKCDECKIPAIMTKSCVAHRNSQCGECDKGFYLSQISLTCQKCSYCFADIKGLTYRMRECNKPGVDKNFQCIEIFQPPYQPPKTPKINESATEIDQDSGIGFFDDLETDEIFKENYDDIYDIYDDDDEKIYDSQVDTESPISSALRLTKILKMIRNLREELHIHKIIIIMLSIIGCTIFMVSLIYFIVMHMHRKRYKLIMERNVLKPLLKDSKMYNINA